MKKKTLVWILLLWACSFSQWNKDLDTTHLLSCADKAEFLGISGAAICGTGLVSQLIGEIFLISSMYGRPDSSIYGRPDSSVSSMFDRRDHRLATAYLFLVPGYVLSSLGPIFSLKGEKLLTVKGFGYKEDEVEFKSQRAYYSGLICQGAGLLLNLLAISTADASTEISLIAALTAPLVSIAGGYFEGNAAAYVIRYANKVESLYGDRRGAASPRILHTLTLEMEF
jgi:hypothetical protein